MIPVLLLKDGGFVKTTKFKDPVYLGDPINIIRIFNEKEVDEIAVLDIGASIKDQPPDFEILQEIADECFMPLSYGGGLKTLDDCRRVFALGYEKVILNSCLATTAELVSEAAEVFGSQAVVASIDVKKSFLGGYQVWTKSGTHNLKTDPVTFAKRVEALGAGEILLNAIDGDGAMKGYDLDLIAEVSGAVDIPVVACGGAGSIGDLVAAIRDAEASAVAAGAMFVFYGPHRAVLINPPTFDDFQEALGRNEAS